MTQEQTMTAANIENGLSVKIQKRFTQYLKQKENQEQLLIISKNLSLNKEKNPRQTILFHLDIDDLCQFSQLGKFLIEHPEESLQLFDSSIKKELVLIDPVSVWDDFFCQILLHSDKLEYTPFNKLNQLLAFHLVKLSAIVVIKEDMQFHYTTACFECPVCGIQFIIPENNDFKAPYQCHNSNCKNTKDFKLIQHESIFYDEQHIFINEYIDKSLPQIDSLEVLLTHSLVNMVNPGDRIELTGVLQVAMHEKNSSTKTKKVVFHRYILATGLKIIKPYAGIAILEAPTKKQLLIDFSIDYLEETGTFLVDEAFPSGGMDHIYYMKGLWLLPITSKAFIDSFFPHLMDLLRNEKAFLTHIVKRSRNYIQKKIYQNYFYDESADTLYVSDRGCHYYKITPLDITIFENGEQNIFFMGDMNHSDAINLEQELGSSQLPTQDFREAFRNFVFASDLEQKEGVDISYGYCLSVPFQEIIPDRVILNINGEPGSFKTTFERELLRILTDRFADVVFVDSKKPDDFQAVLSNNKIVGLDNVENFSVNSLDQLATASTGSKYAHRELYTTNTPSYTGASCWIILNGMDPNITRPDVISRTISIKLDKKENILYAQKKDTTLFSDGNKVKAYFRRFLLDLQKMLSLIKQQPTKMEYRMVDFFRVFRAALLVMGYNEGTADELIKKLPGIEHMYLRETNEVLSLLTDLVKGEITHTIIDPKTNTSKEEPIPFSCNWPGLEIKSILKYLMDAGLKTEINTKSLARLINMLKGEFRKEDVEIETIITPHAKARKYLIYLKGQRPQEPKKLQTKVEDFTKQK